MPIHMLSLQATVSSRQATLIAVGADRLTRNVLLQISLNAVCLRIRADDRQEQILLGRLGR